MDQKGSVPIHPGFETQNRCHHKYKTGLYKKNENKKLLCLSMTYIFLWTCARGHLFWGTARGAGLPLSWSGGTRGTPQVLSKGTHPGKDLGPETGVPPPPPCELENKPKTLRSHNLRSRAVNISIRLTFGQVEVCVNS